MKKKKFSKKYILLLLIPVILLVLFRASMVRKTTARDQAMEFNRRPLVVKTALARNGAITRSLDAVARVEPDQKMEVTSRIMTLVEEIKVSEGHIVQKGDVLLVLDNRDLKQNIRIIEAQIAQTEAQINAGRARTESISSSLGFWKAESERDTFLEKNGAISQSAAEATRTRYMEVLGSLKDVQQSTLALQHLKENLSEQKKAVLTEMDYRILRSPVTAMVTVINVDPGDMAAPGSPLLVLENRSSLKLVFSLPQEDAVHIKEGQELFFSWQGTVRTARVTSLFPSIDAARMLKVEAELQFQDGENIMPSTGMTLPVNLVMESMTKALLIPLSAVSYDRDGNAFTYLVKDNILQGDEKGSSSASGKGEKVLAIHPLTVLMENGEFAAVRGISVNDEVVTSSYMGALLLADGLRVVVAE